jgi:hypothetical protein
MKTPSWYVPRRKLLQTSGTAIALPALEAMMRPGKRARADELSPRRFLMVLGQVFGYVGHYDQELKRQVAPWTPKARGRQTDIENNSYLKPFFDKKIESKLTILSGLVDESCANTHASPIKLVAGSFPVKVQDGSNAFLEPTPNGSSPVKALPKPDPFKGATADMITAAHLGRQTVVPHLVLNLGYRGGGGGKYSFGMSYKSISTAVPADNQPSAVFNRLFAGYDPKASLEDIKRRARLRKSVIDGVQEDVDSLKGRLGRSDTTKLADYLDSVRHLERLVERASMATSLPAGVKAPASNLLALPRQKAMQELIVNAFATDRTRVVYLSCQYPGAWLKFRGTGQDALEYNRYKEFSGAALGGDHHNVSHTDQGRGGGAPSAAITAEKRDWMQIFTHWALEEYSEILAGLDGHRDIDGISTVLDNTVAVYGGDNSDSTRHGNTSQPCIIGGRGGSGASGWRIKSGRHLRFADYGAGAAASQRTWQDLLWGTMNMMGVPDPDGSPRIKGFAWAKHPLDEELS